MFDLIVGTQGYYWSITFQVSTVSREGLQPLSFIISRSEPFRPVKHFTVCIRWNIPANSCMRTRHQIIWGERTIFNTYSLISFHAGFCTKVFFQVSETVAFFCWSDFSKKHKTFKKHALIDNMKELLLVTFANKHHNVGCYTETIHKLICVMNFYPHFSFNPH